jgi:hypothetical protein
MNGRDELPPLPPLTAVLLALLALTGWLAARVALLRRRTARRAPGEPPVPAAAWLRALAGRRHLGAVLAAIAVVLVLAIAWSLFAR